MAEIAALSWEALEPRFAALLAEPLAGSDVADWLRRWSDLQLVVWEARAGLKRPRLRDLTDDVAAAAFNDFGVSIMAPFHAANQQLTEKLLAVPDYKPIRAHSEMLRRLRDEADLFRSENLALEVEIAALTSEYDRLIGGISVSLNGRELIGPELEAALRDPDPAAREAAWRAESAAWLAHRDNIGALFLRVVALRGQLARNAGLPDYRVYRWRELGRLDYAPADALNLDESIGAEIVPLAARCRAAQANRLGLDTLRPWDLAINPDSDSPGRLFPNVTAFADAMQGVFARLDPEFGDLFARMRGDYLDLGWRKGKPAGGEEWLFPVTGLPCIRLDREGTSEAVLLLLHEMGHALHDYSALNSQRLFWNLGAPTEFEEFAAISMTLFARQQLATEHGGFYSPEQQADNLSAQLTDIVTRWLPDIAQTDAFQQWLYTVPLEQLRVEDLDAKWRELGALYAPWTDWSDLDAESGAGWTRVRLLFGSPFYVIAYAFAYIGALQAWRNSQDDPEAAWSAYRAALTFGNTRPLRRLFATANVRMPSDPGVIAEIATFVAGHISC